LKREGLLAPDVAELLERFARRPPRDIDEAVRRAFPSWTARGWREWGYARTQIWGSGYSPSREDYFRREAVGGVPLGWIMDMAEQVRHRAESAEKWDTWPPAGAPAAGAGAGPAGAGGPGQPIIIIDVHSQNSAVTYQGFEGLRLPASQEIYDNVPLGP
jgi:hypothetical protein